MFRSKYSTVLTIILIVVIIAIIIIATILSINAYKEYKDEKDRNKAYAAMQEQIPTKQDDNTTKDDNSVVEEGNSDLEPIDPNSVPNTVTPNTNTSGETTSKKTTKFYKNYPMIGYIKIQKTNVEYPILTDQSPGALETSVCVMYPSNPQLNQQGNVVIIGHNYRNGKLFSNNSKLEEGDKIQITDLNGQTLTYTIYQKMIIPESDTEYITKDRGENIEISLSTCTDDGKARLVLLARVQ